MRELSYYVAVSIDGFIATPDGGYDAFLVEGDHMNVLLGKYGDAVPAHVLRAVGQQAPRTRFDTVIQGWNSYDIAYSIGIERPYAHLREYVATRSNRAPVAGVTFTADPLATVRELKREDGLGIYLCGGGQLAGALLPEIDRLILKRSPVAFGAGIPLFGSAGSVVHNFRLVDVRRFASGVVIEEYDRADQPA